MSLQHATCKLPEPFAIPIGESRRTQFGALILLAPSESIIEEKYANCMMWGLSWFGTTENAEIARQLLLSLNQGLGFTVSMAKYKFLGGSIARLFNSISAHELLEVGVDHIADIITTDFIKLSSSLCENRDLFLPLPPGETEKRQEELPKKADIEKAICFIRSKTDRKEIRKAEIFEIVEAEFERKGIRLKLDWRGTTEGKLRDWFG